MGERGIRWCKGEGVTWERVNRSYPRKWCCALSSKSVGKNTIGNKRCGLLSPLQRFICGPMRQRPTIGHPDRGSNFRWKKKQGMRIASRLPTIENNPSCPKHQKNHEPQTQAGMQVATWAELYPWAQAFPSPILTKYHWRLGNNGGFCIGDCHKTELTRLLLRPFHADGCVSTACAEGTNC